jgi:ArsR family metal-binding transcriptional regulator
MAIETETSSFIDRDRSSLDKAHELKEKANEAYKQHDYRHVHCCLPSSNKTTLFNANCFSQAVKLYHQCLLNAKAVV